MATPPARRGPFAGPPPPGPVDSGSPFTPSVALGRRVLLFMAAVLVSAIVGYALTHVPLILVVGALGALVGGLLIIYYPMVGLLLYLLLFILRLGEVFPALGALHLERLIGAGTLAALVLHNVQKHGSLVLDSSPQTKALLVFMGTVLLSIPFSYWRGESINTFMELVKILGLYIMAVHIIDTPRKLHVFVWAYLLGVLYLNLDSLHNYYAGRGAFAQGIDRATGATSAAGNANELGTTLACTFPLYLFYALRERAKWRRVLAGGAGLAAVWGMILTGSRASLLGFLGGLVYLWWGSRRRVLLAAVGVAFLALGFAVMPAQYKGRYETIGSGNLDESSQARVKTWLTGLQMFLDRPLTGVGAGCFGVARAMSYSPGLKKSWLESHSLYIQVVTEVGLIGAIAFFIFVARFLKLNRRVAALLARAGPQWSLERAFTKAVFAGFVVLLISGIFGHSLYRRTWYLYAGLGLALFRILRDTRPELFASEPDRTHAPELPADAPRIPGNAS